MDNERDQNLSLRVAGRTIPLGTSEANGHFEALAVFKVDELPGADPRGVCLQLSAGIPMHGGTRRELTLELDLHAADGLSVLSDIDDTIKISDVRNKRALVTNTFCRPYCREHRDALKRCRVEADFARRLA